MIAVVQVGGHQAIVSGGDVIRVDKMHAELGATVELPVMLMSNEDGSNCTVGAPVIEGTTVKATVVEHGRGDKIRVFKMKPRKRYRRTYGHRQDYTVIEIAAFGETKKKKPAAKKKAEDKKTEEKPKAKKTAAKKAPAKKVETKEKTEKKPAAKKKAAPKKEAAATEAKA